MIKVATKHQSFKVLSISMTLQDKYAGTVALTQQLLSKERRERIYCALFILLSIAALTRSCSRFISKGLRIFRAGRDKAYRTC